MSARSFLKSLRRPTSSAASGAPWCTSVLRYVASSASIGSMRSINTSQTTVKLDTASIPTTPLSQPLSMVANVAYANDKPKTSSQLYESQITTLENGLKVVSAPHFGEFCTVGVLIDAGCRYEVGYPSGVTNFLEKMAFSATENYPDQQMIYTDLENHGGICDCQSTRDTFIYAASCHVSGMSEVVSLLADAVLRPIISEENMTFTRDIIRFTLEDATRNPNPEPLLTDFVHMAAYRNNTLGLPKFCPEENVDEISSAMLFGFMKQHFVPERMVLVGVGVDHDHLVETAQTAMVEDRAIWDKNVSLLSSINTLPDVDRSTAQYTGGSMNVEADLTQVAMGPSPMPNLAHLMIGLESASYFDADFVPFCVLHSLMGGGGSFSAGGPGKGMYTRLYVNVLNQYHWMYNATAYHHVYADSGLFCIHASADPKQLGDVTEVIVKELIAMSADLTEEEINRAKNQLKSMLMMNIEQRPVMFEDVGRQVLGHGSRKTPIEYMQEIDAVSKSDLERVVDRTLSSKPSVVGYGDVKHLQSVDKIEQAFAKRNSSLLRPSRLFPFLR